MRKLLILSTDTVHVYNYLDLIKGYFDEVLLVSDAKNPDYRGEVRVVDFSIRNPISILKTGNSLRRIIKDFGPSVIHIHQANSVALHLFRALKDRTVPVVLTAWGSDVLVAPKRNCWLRKMVVGNLRRADVLTSDSRYMAKIMQDLLGDDRRDIRIANFGINLYPHGLKKEKLIYSNRLHKPLYRIDAIINAFSRFISRSENADWKLFIAATGEETQRLKELVRSLQLDEHIRFEGWVEKERNLELFARAAVFVSVPESDATSISLLEAMAHGCIPVVSDLPANREWIQDGINGLLVADVNTNFLDRLIEVDASNLVLMNKKLMEQEATKEVNRERFLACYDQLLKDNR